MLRGLYTSASSLTNLLKKNEVCANNLANTDTNGFKKQGTVSKTFAETLLYHLDYEKGPQGVKTPIGTLGKGVVLDEVYTNYNQGALENTGGQLDIALEGQGFLVVEDTAGNQFYTRNGSLKLSPEGILTTQTGHIVRGTGGPIQINGSNINITEQGEVYVDGQLAGVLQVVDITNPYKVGDSLVQGENPTPQTQTKIRQGFVEKSNVSAVEEMTRLITIMRVYETNQKVIQAYDNTLDKLINQAGNL